MCGGRSSILHYGPLIETNYLYAPTPNGQKPECVAKQTQYPLPRPRGLFQEYNIKRWFYKCLSFATREFSLKKSFFGGQINKKWG